MKQVSHVNDIVGLHDDYGCYGVFTKQQFQVIKECDTNYPVPAILSKVMILPLSVLIYEYGHPNIERMIYFSKRTGEPSIWE